VKRIRTHDRRPNPIPQQLEEKDPLMTAEIIRLIPATRIVGEHLRCPVCNGRDAYANIGAQSFAFCRRHNTVWLGEQDVGRACRQRWIVAGAAE
jgi:hypothetical protein